MGLNIDAVLIHAGRDFVGTSAVLRNKSGKVMKPPMANTVSELLVFIPNANEIPDHASPKKAIVKKISTIPTMPVVT